MVPRDALWPPIDEGRFILSSREAEEEEEEGEINGGSVSRSEIIELRLSHLVIVSFADAENKETGMSGTDRVV